jgi:long-chain acyl-CoA synthetase
MLLRSSASRQFARASRVAGNRQNVVHPLTSTTKTKIAACAPLLGTAASRHFSLSSSSADAIALNNIDSSGSIGLSRQALKEQGILDENAFCVNFKTLHEMQRNACLAFASNELFGTHSEVKKDFEWMNYQNFCRRVHLTRSVLQHDLGCREFSKIGIIANNRWEWAAIACAAYSMNATIVPMYEAQLPADWTYILNDAGCDALFCATQEIFDTCHKEVLPYVSTLHGSMCLNEHREDGEASQYCFNFALDRAEDRMQSTTGGYNDGILEPTPQDLADLVYTSGTTGKPKGVELTHRNIVSNIQSVTKMVDNPHDFLGPWDKSLAFLPWAHSYGQTCELWAGIAHGGSIGVCRGVPHILEDLSMVKPTILYSVPTLYKRVYDGVNTLMLSGSPVKQKMMRKAFDLAKENRLAKQDGLSLGFVKQMQYNMLNSLILDKVRARFGGNLRLGFLGGAACPKEILEFMDDLGIPIYEGYGLTETSPIITLNVPGKRMLGSVGKPLPDFNVVVCDENGNILPTGSEGEICCYGPSVMRGYHNKPKETMEVLSLAPDGKSEL